MRKLEIKCATELRGGYVVCPECDTTQDEYVTRDTETGTYKCTYCGDAFLVEQTLVDRDVPTVGDLEEKMDNLATRVRRLEKELGIK